MNIIKIPCSDGTLEIAVIATCARLQDDFEVYLHARAHCANLSMSENLKLIKQLMAEWPESDGTRLQYKRIHARKEK